MKKLLPFFLCLCLCAGCRPSYPREKVAQCVQDLVKREYRLDSKAALAGNTLYLNVTLPGLAVAEPKALMKSMDKLQDAVQGIMRVAFSTDAKINYVVVTGSDPAWKLGMRVIQRIQDVKDYFYQRIGRNDYEGRLILEMGDEFENGPAADQRQLSSEEFIGRLIVSQFNMMTRNNPFLGVVLDNARLRYIANNGAELVVAITAEAVNEKTSSLFERLLSVEAKKVLGKYKTSPLKTIRLVTPTDQIFSIEIAK